MMKTPILRLTFVLAITAVAFSQQLTAAIAQDATVQTTDDPLAAVAWMAGDWHGASGPITYEECWTKPAGGAMIGMFRLLNSGEFALSETLSMEAEDGKVVMRIIHFGRQLQARETEPLVAVATEITATKAVFASPEGEASPLKITYELSDDGESLTATVETERDGQPTTFGLPFKRGKPE